MIIIIIIMTKLVICIFFAFSDIFSCVLLQLMHYVDVCCWVGLCRVRSAYISCGLGWVCKLIGWVGLGHRKWTHDHVWKPLLLKSGRQNLKSLCHQKKDHRENKLTIR